MYQRHATVMVASYLSAFFVAVAHTSPQCENGVPCGARSFIQLKSARRARSFSADEAWHDIYFHPTKKHLYMQPDELDALPDPKLDFGETFLSSEPATAGPKLSADAMERWSADAMDRLRGPPFPLLPAGHGLDLSIGDQDFVESHAALEPNARYNLALNAVLEDMAQEEVERRNPSRVVPAMKIDPALPPRKGDRLKANVSLVAPATDASSWFASLRQRTWTPVVQAAKHAAGRIYGKSGFIDGSGIVLLGLVVMASSGMALLAFGRVAHGNELAHARIPPIFGKPRFGYSTPVGGSQPQLAAGSPFAEATAGSEPRSSLDSQANSRTNQGYQCSPGDFTPYGEPLPPSHYLCSGLVVPRRSECILAVPILEAASGSSICIIRDLAGQPTLQAEIRKPDWQCVSGRDLQPFVTLSTCSMNESRGQKSAPKLLAYCKVAHHVSGHHEGQPRACIYHANGNLFGTLFADPGANCHFVLASTRGNIRLDLEGDFKKHAVKVWSGSRLLFGDSSSECSPAFDESGEYWQLRVLANMDVCLLLAALLSAELLEGSRRPGILV